MSGLADFPGIFVGMFGWLMAVFLTEFLSQKTLFFRYCSEVTQKMEEVLSCD